MPTHQLTSVQLGFTNQTQPGQPGTWWQCSMTSPLATFRQRHSLAGSCFMKSEKSDPSFLNKVFAKHKNQQRYKKLYNKYKATFYKPCSDLVWWNEFPASTQATHHNLQETNSYCCLFSQLFCLSASFSASNLYIWNFALWYCEAVCPPKHF